MIYIVVLMFKSLENNKRDMIQLSKSTHLMLKLGSRVVFYPVKVFTFHEYISYLTSQILQPIIRERYTWFIL